MNTRTIFVTLTCLGSLLMACSDDETTNSTATTMGNGGSGGSNGGNGGSAGGQGGEGGGMMGTGRIRIAHLSPDAPAVDFCVDAGDGFIGPVLAGSGDMDGLAYTEVTDYLTLPAVTYTARLVAPGSTDCDTPLGPPDTTGLTLPEGIDATVAAIGMLTPEGMDEAFELTVYVDDNTAPDMGMAKLRFIHASPDTPAVDVGTGSEANADFAVVWDNTSYPDIGTTNGENYLVTPPLMGVTVSAQANDAGMDALVIPGVDLPEGAVATAFAIGNLDGAPQPLKVLLCVDSADVATCSVVP